MIEHVLDEEVVLVSPIDTDLGLPLEFDSLTP
jgi:hypothetical protein